MEGTLLLPATPTFLTSTKTIFKPCITSTTHLYHTSSVSFGSKHSLLGSRIAPVHCVSSSSSDASSVSSEDAILLDVRVMMCGGCTSSVKKILENQAQVSSADVDLTTETATVCPVAEVKVHQTGRK